MANNVDLGSWIMLNYLRSLDRCWRWKTLSSLALARVQAQAYPSALETRGPQIVPHPYQTQLQIQRPRLKAHHHPNDEDFANLPRSPTTAPTTLSSRGPEGRKGVFRRRIVPIMETERVRQRQQRLGLEVKVQEEADNRPRARAQVERRGVGQV